MPSNITLLYFFSSNILCFDQEEPIKVQDFEIFVCSDQSLSNSLFQFWNDKSIPPPILHHFHEILSTVNFKLIHFLLWIIPSKSQFGDFKVLWLKFPKFLISFLKVQVSFRLNFASIFSAIKNNSSVIF